MPAMLLRRINPLAAPVGQGACALKAKKQTLI
jgi:hypothetical protein